MTFGCSKPPPSFPFYVTHALKICITNEIKNKLLADANVRNLVHDQLYVVSIASQVSWSSWAKAAFLPPHLWPTASLSLCHVGIPYLCVSYDWFSHSFSIHLRHSSMSGWDSICIASRAGSLIPRASPISLHLPTTSITLVLTSKRSSIAATIV